jgi:16S rRNA (cytosine1402-N4)-methyltransferase
MEQVPSCLRAGGRVAILAFHSVEDRIVKDDFRTRGRCGEYRVLTKKPVVASESERAENPRSRSAKLRVAELAAQARVGT